MPLVAAQMLERLKEWGVHRVYGYPGDGINGFLGAFEEVSEPIFTQARHEEMAAFMACAHAKFTGDIGACIATSGPGAIHLINGLYDAKLDHQPVVAIVGQQKRMSVGAHYQQEVDLQVLFKDVAGFVSTVMDEHSSRHVLDRAVKSALTERRPSVVIVPEDVQESEYSDPPRMHGATYTSVGWNQPHEVPDDKLLRRAAEILNESERVAILIGQGAKKAAAEVVEVAEVLGAGIAKALLGKDVVPDTLPFVTGAIGLLGTEPSNKMMMNCDALFMIGTSFPYAEWLPPEGQARCVEIDIDGSLIGVRYPNDVSLVGDAKDTLKALMPMLERKTDRRWRELIEGEVATWRRVLEDRAHQKGDPVNPQYVFWELDQRLPDRAIFTSDSGSATNWFARYVQLREGMQSSLSGTLATMLPGVPYAIGAKFAFPERPVIAFTGDGAFSMLGMNELITVKRYRDELVAKNPTLIFAVMVNEDLNQVSYEQRVLSADPKNPATQTVPYVPAAEFAKLLGIEGIKVSRPEEVGPAWDRALSADGPVLLEFVVDPQIPPLPPHVRPSMLKKTLTGLARGDEDALGIAEKGFKGKWSEFAEHAKNLLPGEHGPEHGAAEPGAAEPEGDR
jgi:pyruvate dehydrogenase (quinone)